MNDNHKPLTPGVVLYSGVIRQTVRQSAEGASYDFSRVGQKIFFIDVIEADGGLITMWDGSSYEAGILEAEVLGKDFGLPVRDEVVGGAA